MKPKCNLKAGDRIRLLSMDDPDPISAGTIGTVVAVYPQSDWTQVDVDWDGRRSLMLSIPPDQVQSVDASPQNQSGE
ncbi:DUF4314 domain-containing protein [Stieleria sp.]|uniref:DUF4314 domain-containing protein n=1 Tax=Stieleria sp. TaxID=2795976 RepID=UPI00356251AD